VTGVWGADAVEHTLATVVASDHVLANLATTLRRASATLTGSSGRAARRQVARRDPLAPYTSDEFADLLDAATTIAPPLWRARICLLVATHAGAGLRTADLDLLRPNHATVDGRGVLVRVPGARARLVPVRVELEDLAAAAFDAWQVVRPDGPLLPSNDPSSRCFDRAPWPSGLARPSSARLRATWATWLLAGGASVQAVVTAADIATVESWFAPIRLLADLPEDTYLTQVRGTTSPFARVRTLDGQPWPGPFVPLAENGGGGR
jgi:integrase